MLEEDPSREQLLLTIEKLKQELENLKNDHADLEILLETTIEHADMVEAQLQDLNNYISQTAAEVRAYFGRYLSDEVVASLLETPEGLELGGERRKVTILMCDIRGFSSISEKLSPEKVVDILNIFLGAMTDVIIQYQGTINEFIGDAILVIFGAPTYREDDAQRAIACGIAMQLAMEQVNEQLEQLNLPKIAMGIGINTGEVVVGNIGSKTRAKYAVVGSHVNLTSRIESYTVGGQILISDSTLKDAGVELKINRRMQVEPKGVKEPITIYDISSIEGNYNIGINEKEDNLYNLQEVIPVNYKVLEGKDLGNTIFQGKLVKLSLTGAEILSDNLVTPLTNIKIYLLTGSEEVKAEKDLYAKVLDKEVDNPGSFYICFTTVPPEVEVWLRQLYLDAQK